ncbi:ion transporter [Nocardia huaxiensis]|uniref:ion transporter n=1 Tax=Nocardia huaxiensis TaxID=2755382 RepID=UPI001E64EAD1|nr:ion transporter [Nocardia huaxiensis]UFS98404.1 ion transporter [Nocardia huaxiensis]
MPVLTTAWCRIRRISVLQRERARKLVDSPRFQKFIVAIILVNAVSLGAETSDYLMSAAGGLISFVDSVALLIFVIEMLLKLYAYRLGYFRDPWNCFDFAVVGVALLPASGGLSVLRAFRILRALRLVSATPSMRKVVTNLLAALPGMGSILGLLALVLYVAAVMATKLFGGVTPEYFGSLGTSMWTLFQIMTGEAWPDIARTVMDEKPLAWIFFLGYILISTFVVLNLFLAVMVSAADDVREDENRERHEQETSDENAAYTAILTELTALRAEVRALQPAAHSLTNGHNGTRTTVIYSGNHRPDPHRQLSDAEITQAVLLYRGGESITSIADRLGATTATVRAGLQRRGIRRH